MKLPQRGLFLTHLIKTATMLLTSALLPASSTPTIKRTILFYPVVRICKEEIQIISQIANISDSSILIGLKLFSEFFIGLRFFAPEVYFSLVEGQPTYMPVCLVETHSYVVTVKLKCGSYYFIILCMFREGIGVL